MIKILFVCTGNSCRSPMAAGIMKHLLRDQCDFEVVSAGVAALEGVSANPLAVEVLKKKGIDISGHFGRDLNPDVVNDSYIIVVMTQDHKAAVIERFPESKDKTYLLKEFDEAGDQENMDIADPISRPEEAYVKCINEMQNPLNNLAIKLVNGEI